MAATEPAEARPATWQRRSGLVALVLGAVSLATFLAFFSISVQIPKSLVYRGDTLARIYLNVPTISGLSGAVGVVLAIVALGGSKRSTKVAVIGLAVAVGIFVVFMVFVAEAMAAIAPPAPPSNAAPATVSFAFVPTPPAIAAVASLLALSAMLVWLRVISGRRPAFAGVIMGGVPLVYWVLSLLIVASGAGE